MMNQDKWTLLQNEMRHQPKYPSDSVVRWVKRNIPAGGVVLDNGCGAGRHLVFLAREEYVPYGIDYSKSGIDCAWTRMVNEGFEVFANNIVLSSCTELPFADAFFDGVISYGVLYYLSIDEINKAIGEIFRVLKRGGKSLLYIRTTEDYRYNPSESNKDDCFSCIVQEKNINRSAYKENGMEMRFFNKMQVMRLLCNYHYSDLEINTERIGYDNDLYADVNFLVSFTKI